MRNESKATLLECIAYDVDTPGIPMKTMLLSDNSTCSLSGKETFPASGNTFQIQLR